MNDEVHANWSVVDEAGRPARPYQSRSRAQHEAMADRAHSRSRGKRYSASASWARTTPPLFWFFWIQRAAPIVGRAANTWK